MRFGHILVAYFLIGAVMWGGGVIGFEQIGVGGLFLDQGPTGDGLVVNETQVDEFESVGGVAATASQLFGGGLLAALQFILGILAFMFWPVVTLMRVGAPPQVTAVAGGALLMAFVAGFLRVLRQSA